jgi:UDP-N-acetyl-D-mannosaminuronic acid dehydrogenase
MKKKSPTICVIGLGYIGLPTASILATSGLEVHGVDVNPAVLASLNSGSIHIEEPGLLAMVQGALHSNRLSLHAEPVPSDVFVLAVPTPTGDDFGMDPAYVISATRALLPVLKEGNLVILESTVRPGTSEDIVIPILEEAGWKIGDNLFFTHCPERVMPGKILREFIQNHRIIGANDSRSTELAREVYQRVVEGDLHETTIISAELCKLYENTFRDINIALANEAAAICRELGANVHDIIRLSNLHPRVNLHNPGPGVGGHCISVDPNFIAHRVPKLARLVRLGRMINERQPLVVGERVLDLAKQDPDPMVAVLGVAYKGNVDDVRETPAVPILELLEENDIPFRVHDPHVKNFRWECLSIGNVLEGATLILLLTDHDDFQYIDPGVVREKVRRRRVLDARECLDQARWSLEGFEIHRLGAATVLPR